MAMVDYAFYSQTYMGDVIGRDDFAKFEARAEDVVCIMTKWRVSANTIADLDELTQKLFRKAICAQADELFLNGYNSITGETSAGVGFTVGKVTVQGKSSASAMGLGVMSGDIAPLALAYLEQTGLMHPGVPVYSQGPLAGW